MIFPRSELDGAMYDESNFWREGQFSSLRRVPKNATAPPAAFLERPFPASYSSSDSESSQSRVPKYNSIVIGNSTRSLIQQVSFYH